MHVPATAQNYTGILQGSVQALASESEMLKLRAVVAAIQNASNHGNTETTITAAGGMSNLGTMWLSRGNRGKKRNQTVCSGGGGAQHIISKVSSLQNHTSTAFPYCKRRKAGWGLGTRLVPTLKENLSP